MTERSRTAARPCQDVSVLVVEDHDDSRELFVYALQQAGATVLAVSSVEQALTWLKTVRPHVIVSDLAMPGRDGFSLLQEIRSSPDLADVPAIAVTGQPDMMCRAARSGFQRCLRKPVNITDLCAAVSALVRTRA